LDQNRTRQGEGAGCVAGGRQTRSATRARLTSEERRRAILDFEVISQFRSGLISLFLRLFDVCCQQHWTHWRQPDGKGPTALCGSTAALATGLVSAQPQKH